MVHHYYSLQEAGNPTFLRLRIRPLSRLPNGWMTLESARMRCSAAIDRPVDAGSTQRRKDLRFRRFDGPAASTRGPLPVHLGMFGIPTIGNSAYSPVFHRQPNQAQNRHYDRGHTRRHALLIMPAAKCRKAAASSDYA